KFLMMILMFIGGSPRGTAGGIKTTTFFVLCAIIYTMLKGQEHVKAFHRLIPRETIIRPSNVMDINLITLY
ncbi:TrkH family potassium uptake protein, partial [Massilicoli timonensis]